MRVLALTCLSLSLAGCAAPDVLPDSDTSSPAWQFELVADGLRAQSCPEGIAFERASSIEIKAEPVSKGVARPDSFSGLNFTGAWHLTSQNRGFAGLSGLVRLRSGSLLAVSDAGIWTWIGIDPDTGTPDGFGALADLRDSNGEAFDAKIDSDAEGLDFRDGLALVSFEHDHRISAYDLEGCGAAAREVITVRLPQTVAGQPLSANRGAEALALKEDGTLQVGFETRRGKGSPVTSVLSDGALDQLEIVEQPFLYTLTGMDQKGSLSTQVLRSYDPIRGARVILRVHEGEDLIAEANLKGDLPVDNFEGVAIGTAPNGQTRVWLISDNNFSAEQRTLLFAFDLD